MSVKVIQKVSLAVLKDGKMLMARSAKHQAVFFTLGGKIGNGETERQALEREILEGCGVGGIEKSIKFLKTFEAPAFGKKNTFVKIQKKKKKEQTPPKKCKKIPSQTKTPSPTPQGENIKKNPPTLPPYAARK